jgi:hypothetical protein
MLSFIEIPLNEQVIAKLCATPYLGFVDIGSATFRIIAVRE